MQHGAELGRYFARIRGSRDEERDGRTAIIKGAREGARTRAGLLPSAPERAAKREAAGRADEANSRCWSTQGGAVPAPEDLG